ncbi:unnamed protein product [Orchesella dallaii]|uniref:Uncharacterized protein n=1 Tax=Orchesella dallaii TaxID=48710 RepID=A0ABP1RYG2_9HEXA
MTTNFLSIHFYFTNSAKWLVLSKLLVSRLEGKLLVSNLQRRLLVRVPQRPEVSRSLIVTVPVLWLSEKSVVTRRALSSSSANCPSNVLFVKSLKISRPTCVSRAQPSWLSKKLPKLTWLVFLRTPTCAPFTPSVSPSCPKISNSPDVSVENVLKYTHQ